MKTTKFKTNIKCAACVEKVTPHLNEQVGAENWNVDLSNPQRILTITGEVTETEIKGALQKAGYNADRI